MRHPLFLALIVSTTAACDPSSAVQPTTPNEAGGQLDDPGDPGNDPDTPDPNDDPEQPVGNDFDGDGFAADVDCNDDDDSIFPGATEIACDNVDQDCNGLIDDGVESWQQVREELDGSFFSPADGLPDQVTIVEFENERPSVRRVDEDADGIADRFSYYTYDADGKTIEILCVDCPAGPGLRHDVRTELDYDVDGNQILEQTDLGDDGSWDVIEEWFYEDGLLTLTRTDTNPQAGWEFITEFTYDDQDRLVETREENDGDPEWDTVTTNLFDDDGVQTGQTIDGAYEDGDGVPEVFITFLLDDQGRKVGEMVDEDGDGDTDIEVEMTLDAEGRPTYVRQNIGGGSLVQETSTTYNLLGQKTSETFSSDGTIIFVNEWDYDEFGNLEEEREGYQPGVWTRVKTISWSCI